MEEDMVAVTLGKNVFNASEFAAAHRFFVEDAQAGRHSLDYYVRQLGNGTVDPTTVYNALQPGVASARLRQLGMGFAGAVIGVGIEAFFPNSSYGIASAIGGGAAGMAAYFPASRIVDLSSPPGFSRQLVRHIEWRYSVNTTPKKKEEIARGYWFNTETQVESFDLPIPEPKLVLRTEMHEIAGRWGASLRVTIENGIPQIQRTYFDDDDMMRPAVYREEDGKIDFPYLVSFSRPSFERFQAAVARYAQFDVIPASEWRKQESA